MFLKYPIIGVIVETIGFMGLFGDFFPVILNFLRQLPFIGTFLSLPYIRNVSVNELFGNNWGSYSYRVSFQVADRLAGSRQSAV